jgi:hypothetical protein
LKYI